MSYFTVLLEEPICSTGSLRFFLENSDREMGVGIEIDQHGETVLLVGDEFTVRMQLADVLEDRKAKRGRIYFSPCPLLAVCGR